MKIFKYLASSALLSVSVSAAYAQDYDKGLVAYNTGDYQTALKEILPLADGGNARAQYLIGLMYGWGDGVLQNYIEAVKWYRLSADQGQADAQTTLGGMYADGKGVIQSYAEANKWYRLSADQGESIAQLRLAGNYEDGRGVKQNNVTAHMWYNISSANGYGEAATYRDSIAKKMTREEIAKAQAMAQECMSSGYKNCGD